MAEAKTVVVPTPPAHLPKAVQAKWSKAYEAAFRQAEQDLPQNEGAQRAVALREANKLLRVPTPANHGEAAALVDQFKTGGEDGWKILAHGIQKIEGVEHLTIVTANGKKHHFKVPIQSAKP